MTAIVGGYALVHSLLATRQSKRLARRLLGARLRDGLYRFLFNAQAVVLFAWAARAFVRLSDRTLYRAPAPFDRRRGQPLQPKLVLRRTPRPDRFLAAARRRSRTHRPA